VKNLLIYISIGVMCTSFTIAPPYKSSAPNKSIYPQGAFHFSSTIDDDNEANTIYHTIGLSHNGLSAQAFYIAYKGYKKLLAKKAIHNYTYITICDFTKASSQKRLYVIDVVNNKLLINTFVAHGKNSGTHYATKFSNTPSSLQSSLGFYTTAQTYVGAHGLSLRLKGVDAGFNDNAYARSIVIHGAGYVDGARVNAGIMMGRSFGCPAVPSHESEKIITTIKNGSCLFVYNGDANYTQTSKILNE
jgi:hypothetical protein